MTELALQIGESFIGTGANAAHINTVFGNREGPAGVAWATALATPSQGHVPFVAVLKPSLPTKPITLFVTKAAPASDNHGLMIWGAAQAGVASGVADAVAEGFIAREHLDNSCIITAVWVNPEANDADEVYRNNRLATKNALANGSKNLPSIDEVLENRALPHNPYYTAKE
jgi:5,6,7,8-tetrahydromethanopterin hydro-lyase